MEKKDLVCFSKVHVMVLEHICPGHTQSWSWHTSWWSFPIPCCTIHVKTGQQLAHMLGLTRCCGHGVAHFITCCDIWIVRSFIIAQFMCQHSMFLMQWTWGNVLHATCRLSVIEDKEIWIASAPLLRHWWSRHGVSLTIVAFWERTNWSAVAMTTIGNFPPPALIYL